MGDIDKDVERYVATDLDPIMVLDPTGAWVRFEEYQAKADRIEELEAKLAKAVEALHWIVTRSIILEAGADSLRLHARMALAELKGEK